MPKIVLSDEKVEKVTDGVTRVAKVLRDADMPFVAAQLDPTVKVADLDALDALESRVGVVERFLKLRPPAEPQRKTVEFAVGVLKKRVADAKENP